MKENLQFSNRLQKLMDEAGVNAFRLAKEIGVSHPAIANFLKGQLPKSEHLLALATYFGTSTDWLLTGINLQNLRETFGDAGRLAEAAGGTHEEMTRRFNATICDKDYLRLHELRAQRRDLDQQIESLENSVMRRLGLILNQPEPKR